MSHSAFSFRQRVGKLDWKALSSLSIDDVVLNTKVNDLQHVLDMVTFSDFNPSDVKGNTVDSISQLVNVLQLISEYLLHCQEAQFQNMRNLQHKSDKFKEQNTKLRKDNLSLKEDRKIYQRQLALLRKNVAVVPGLPIAAEDDHKYNHRVPPRVFSVIDASEIAPTQAPGGIVDSLLRHELDTRDFMASLLEDQRKVFSTQMEVFADAMRSRRSDSSAGTVNMMDEMQQRIDAAVCRAVESVHNKFADTKDMDMDTSKAKKVGGQLSGIDRGISRSVSMSKENIALKSDSKNVGDILQAAALEQMEEELTEREEALNDRERLLRQQEVDFAMQQSASEVRATKKARIDPAAAVGEEEDMNQGSKGQGALWLGITRLNAVNAILTLNGRKAAARLVINVIWKGVMRKLLRGWSILRANTQAARDRMLSDEHAKQLTFAAQNGGSAVKQQLDAERSKCAAAIAAQSDLQAALDAARAEIQQLQQTVPTERSIATNQSLTALREGDLVEKLKKEQERAAISSARYNTLKSKSDKEIAELKEKIQVLENLLAEKPELQSEVRNSMDWPRRSGFEPNRRTTASTGTGTSLGLSSGRLSSLQLRSSLKDHYLNSDADEAALMMDVERRMAMRGFTQDDEKLEAQAMAALAQELSSLLQPQ